MCSIVRFLLIYLLVATGGLQLSLAAKKADNQNQFQQASTAKNSIQRNWKYHPLMGCSHPNWVDSEVNSHANSKRQSGLSAQRDHRYQDGTPWTSAASSTESSQLFFSCVLWYTYHGPIPSLEALCVSTRWHWLMCINLPGCRLLFCRLNKVLTLSCAQQILQCHCSHSLGLSGRWWSICWFYVSALRNLTVVSGGWLVCCDRGCFDGISCRPQPVTGYCTTLSSTNTSLSCVSPLGRHHGVYLLECARLHGRFVTALSLEYLFSVFSCSSFSAFPPANFSTFRSTSFSFAVTIISTPSSASIFFAVVSFITHFFSKSPCDHSGPFSSIYKWSCWHPQFAFFRRCCRWLVVRTWVGQALCNWPEPFIVNWACCDVINPFSGCSSIQHNHIVSLGMNILAARQRICDHIFDMRDVLDYGLNYLKTIRKSIWGTVMFGFVRIQHKVIWSMCTHDHCFNPCRLITQ